MSSPGSSTEPAPTGGLSRSYEPQQHEPAIRARWRELGCFHARTDGPGDPFAIVIPPPNVTAALHLGHAFNNTLQDVLVRVHRMRGCRTLWMPGTDHAGIATQTVVEKRLLLTGKKRLDFTRDAFVERVQAWKDEYEAVITDQLASMGCSCDWDRQRFTMDDVCARAVAEAFFRLFRDDLVYRGKRLVNWDPVTGTALADDEVEMREVDGFFWYLTYPLVDDAGNETGEHVTVATTRPETMLGDTGVAVNPADPERAKYIGRNLRLPIVGRIIPIVGDDYVVMPDPGSDDAKAKYASGFLKVTPAHDPNDWEIGQRHGLEAVNVMAADATISDAHGWEDVSDEARAFVGLSREDARKAIVRWFREHDLLEAEKPYRHAVGHSYRSHRPIEPWLSDQWYVRVTDDRLVGEAQRALAEDQREPGAVSERVGADPAPAGDGDGVLRFHPPRYAKMYSSWHENLRDWCISRQLWWGHRIPVWSRLVEDSVESVRVADAVRAHESGDADLACVRTDERPDGTLVLVALNLRHERAEDVAAELETAGFERDEDVLDTWFSSALWPLSTMGWPEPDQLEDGEQLLETFNPTNVLVTGRDIITLWVSRMVMFNRHFHGGRVPFRDVCINPMIQDGHGQRMSKSLGNGVDPRDIIHSHGADALRFSLVQMATGTQDARLPVDMVSPFTGETFAPKEITSPEGHRVAAPEQACPSTGRTMISGYGAASGRAQPTDDVPLARNTSPRFDVGRNFCNKLFNAVRFALGTMDAAAAPVAPAAIDLASRPLADRWIVGRLVHTIAGVDQALAEYRFSAYAELMYDLVWRDLCDWYLEAVKPTVREDPVQQHVLRTVIDAVLRLLHPAVPFVTETLWPAVREAGATGIDGLDLPGADALAIATWPAWTGAPPTDTDQDAWRRMQDLVAEIRGVKARHEAPVRRPVTLLAPPAVLELVRATDGVAEHLAAIERTAGLDDDAAARAIPAAFEGEEIRIAGVVDEVDVAAERERLEKLVAEKEKALATFRKKLANPGYVNNAPADVVEETRRRADATESDLEAARTALEALGED